MKPLLNDEDDSLTPEFENVLKQIFTKFDEDKDGALCKEELNNFAIFTNGEPFDHVSLEEIEETFEVNDKGYLTLQGFLDLYQLQTLGDEDETRKDLKKHGYDEDLCLCDVKPIDSRKPIDSEKKDESPVAEEAEKTPREE